MAASARRKRPLPASRPRAAVPGAATSGPITHGFLFADLRGYTHFVEANGDLAGAELLDAYRSLVRDAVTGTSGAEIQTEGDSFFLVFGSASAAIRCGLAIVAAAANEATGTRHRMGVGVGIHAGEAVETHGGFVGSAVNIAARLCAQAAPGEVLVSETVRSLAHGSLEASYEALGARRLKGVDEPVTVYRASRRDEDRARPTAPGSDRPSQRVRAIGVAGTALLLVTALASVAWLRSGVPPASPPGGSPGGLPTADAPTRSTAAPGSERLASAAAAAVLTTAELVLLDRIPLEFQPYCHRSTVEDGAAGGLASIRCDLRGSPGQGADTVWYDAFDETSRGAMGAAVGSTVAEAALPAVEGPADAVLERCRSGGEGAVGRWYLGSTFAGQVACFPRDGAAWLLWTYEGPDILARAVRGDGDPEQLQSWWRDHAADYLRP